jgi:intracellular sulfur oxidation DsrE/DsrF family protein
MPRRRAFLAQLAATAATFSFDPAELKAASATYGSPWDTSWIAKLESARYRVVFNVDNISDGIVGDYVSTFLDQFHEVHNTKDADTRAVVVFRRNGTGLGFNDAMWDKYGIGEYAKVKDPSTKANARRNIFWHQTLEKLTGRGMIAVVCNVATHGYSYGLAEQNRLQADAIYEDLKANLIPGAVMAPSGIFALIRAQNAGCAWMPGT